MGADMATGPVRLLVLGFSHPDFHGEIIEELERLRQSDTARSSPHSPPTRVRTVSWRRPT
jgi:hypothetical protein